MGGGAGFRATEVAEDTIQSDLVKDSYDENSTTRKQTTTRQQMRMTVTFSSIDCLGLVKRTISR
jgi:hypothetical protein